VLKKVETESTEVHISKYLTNHPGEGTHAITVLEVIPMPDNVKRAFLVMPRMRVCDYEPYFKTVLEFTEFLQQVLEVCTFLSTIIFHRGRF
jgi:desulfoferrodoxin (superoxide reductase-like protein)